MYVYVHSMLKPPYFVILSGPLSSRRQNIRTFRKVNMFRHWKKRCPTEPHLQGFGAQLTNINSRWK